MRRKLWAILATAITVGTFASAVGAAPAQAAQGCGGRLVGSHVLDGGKAQVDVYLENGTTNCLVNRTRGDSWGTARGMGIMVSTRNSDIAIPQGDSLCYGMTNTATRKADCSASYAFWAGPVRVYAPGMCLYFTATVRTASGFDGNKWKNYHCG